MREYLKFSRHRIIHSIIAELLDLLDMIIVSMFCIVLLFTYVFHIATVNGSSMYPTMVTDDQLLVNNLAGQPQAGDILIINVKNANLLDAEGEVYTDEGLGKTIVKRVIAVENDVVDIDFETGVVIVNGEALEENYVNTPTTSPVSGGAFEYPITIPEGYVFVMGDNRDVSLDSRYRSVGLVHKSDISGKVVLRIYPWEDFGPLTVKE